MKDFLLEENNDMFGTYSKAKTITDYYNSINQTEEENIDKMTALYGSWGSGKSTIMKYVFDYVDIDIYNPIWFDSWLYEKDENLAMSLLHKIYDDSWKSLPEKVKKAAAKAFGNLVGVFKGYASGLSSSVSIPGLVKVEYSVDKAMDRIKELEQENIEKSFHLDLKKVNEEFTKIIPKKKTTLIFLDDLDRCEHDSILNLLSAIFNIFSKIDNVLIIAGVDNQAVVKALSYRYGQDLEKAEHYLEKVFTRDYYVSHPKGATEVINQNISNCIPDFIGMFNKCNITNPRTLLKTFKKYNQFIYDTRDDVDLHLLYKEVQEDTKIYHFILLYMIYLIQNHYKEYQNFLDGHSESVSYSKLFMVKTRGGEISAGTLDSYEIPLGMKISRIFNYHSRDLSNDALFKTKTIIRKVPSFLSSYGQNSEENNKGAYSMNAFMSSLRFSPVKIEKHSIEYTGTARTLYLQEFNRLFNEEISSGLLKEAQLFRVNFSQFLMSTLNGYLPSSVSNQESIIVCKDVNLTLQEFLMKINNYL